MSRPLFAELDHCWESDAHTKTPLSFGPSLFLPVMIAKCAFNPPKRWQNRSGFVYKPAFILEWIAWRTSPKISCLLEFEDAHILFTCNILTRRPLSLTGSVAPRQSTLSSGDASHPTNDRPTEIDKLIPRTTFLGILCFAPAHVSSRLLAFSFPFRQNPHDALHFSLKTSSSFLSLFFFLCRSFVFPYKYTLPPVSVNYKTGEP